MATGKHGSINITGTLEATPGGVATNFHGFLRSGIEIGHSAETAETTAISDAFREHTPTGVKNHDDIEMTLIFDDTATSGTYAIFGTVDDGPQDDGRALVIVISSSSVTYTVDVRLTKFKVVASLDDIQMVHVTLRPTGAGVWS